MSLVIDTLRTSTIAEELGDDELEIISGLFKVQNYKPGEIIVQPGDHQPDHLYILAQGEIQVKIQSSEGEASIYVLKPGDLAGIITFVGGAASQHSATLIAKGEAKVLSLPRAKFETLIDSHPMIEYKVMRGIVRYVHGIVRSMNAKSAELSNYIYRSSGGY
ncbi:MAG: cyclic nucleotide-binding domain-containing protein [Gallionella sp.]|nr:cyclic nucleotide-binding domain-containing protein [Gallionella sp.]